MKINGTHYRTIWLDSNGRLKIIDQRELPDRLVIEELESVEDVAEAIKEMHVRGAVLIGATAGYGMYLADLEARVHSLDNLYFDKLNESAERLISTRPTAVNLERAVKKQIEKIKGAKRENRAEVASRTADEIADEDAE